VIKLSDEGVLILELGEFSRAVVVESEFLSFGDVPDGSEDHHGFFLDDDLASREVGVLAVVDEAGFVAKEAGVDGGGGVETKTVEETVVAQVLPQLLEVFEFNDLSQILEDEFSLGNGGTCEETHSCVWNARHSYSGQFGPAIGNFVVLAAAVGFSGRAVVAEAGDAGAAVSEALALMDAQTPAETAATLQPDGTAGSTLTLRQAIPSFRAVAVLAAQIFRNPAQKEMEAHRIVLFLFLLLSHRPRSASPLLFCLFPGSRRNNFPRLLICKIISFTRIEFMKQSFGESTVVKQIVVYLTARSGAEEDRHFAWVEVVHLCPHLQQELGEGEKGGLAGAAESLPGLAG
jgi:hypothetical protein